MPFAVAMPYPQGAEQVQVLQNGQVLTTEQIPARMLRDAVESLADAEFAMNPTQRRQALLNKIDALDAQLKAGDLVGARHMLSNDIRTSLSDWLVDGTSPSSPWQYTKTSILALVDELAQRLAS
jgi:hypothetical protein